MANKDRSEYEKFSILSADGTKEVDIRLGVVSFVYFENIFSPYLTAKAIITNTGNTVVGKDGKFLYTLGIGNPFYANYQHIGYEDRPYMGGPVSSAKIEIAIPLHIEPTSFVISKRDMTGKYEDIQEILIK